MILIFRALMMILPASDVRDADGVPKVFKLSNDDQNYFKKYFHTLPPENKVKHRKDIIYNLINKLNIVSSKRTP